jgi:hypothetical protein
MPTLDSDFSDSDSDSDSDRGIPVSLDCNACKKKFKSTDRGCDKDEKTCSTCTKKANKLLMDAFMIEPTRGESSKAAVAVASVTTPETSNAPNDSTEEAAAVDSCVRENVDGPTYNQTPTDMETFTTPQSDSSKDSISQAATTPTPRTKDVDDEDTDDGNGSDEGRQGPGDSSDSDHSEGESKVTKKRKKKRKNSVGNFDADVDDLLDDETSIECVCGGQTRTLVRKTFKMDQGTTIRLFCDLELLDVLPLLYSYFILSAHVNPTLKRSVRGMRVVVDEGGKKMVVLCVFRSKCPNPRYDIIILDPAEPDQTKAVKRICGLTNFFKWYKYVPDETFDNEYAIQMLKDFLMSKFDDKGRSLVYDSAKGPNKDEMGRPMSDGYDPSNPNSVDKDGISPAASKRVSTKRFDLSAEQVEDTPWIRKRLPNRRKAAAKKKLPVKQKVSISMCKQVNAHLIIMLGSGCHL